MRTLKHLPENEWPEADRQALRAAYEPGDIFDETAGPGAHLAEGTRKAIKFTYRRWLGFLKANYPDDLSNASGRAYHAGAGARLHRPSQCGDRAKLGRHRCRPSLRRRAADCPND